MFSADRVFQEKRFSSYLQIKNYLTFYFCLRNLLGAYVRNPRTDEAARVSFEIF